MTHVRSVSLTAALARLRPLTFAVLAGRFCRALTMFFSFQGLPTTRHPSYSTNDENDGKYGENDHVKHDSVHHTLSFQVPNVHNHTAFSARYAGSDIGPRRCLHAAAPPGIWARSSPGVDLAATFKSPGGQVGDVAYAQMYSSAMAPSCHLATGTIFEFSDDAQPGRDCGAQAHRGHRWPQEGREGPRCRPRG